MNFRNIIFSLALILFCAQVFAQTPELNFPDRTVQMNTQEQGRILDLRDYARDDSTPSNRSYAITMQTNPELIDCFIEDNFYISCNEPSQDETGLNSITIKVTNGRGLSSEDTFSILVEESDIPSGRVELSASPQTLSIENDQSGYVNALLRNGTDERKCFEIKTSLDSRARQELDIEVFDNSVCLDEKESLEFTVQVNTSSAMARDYDVSIVAYYSEGSARATFRVEVLDTEEKINIERLSDYFVCIEPYEQEIEVRLENNSSSRQSFNLSAENSSLLPEVEFANTTLNARSSTEMDITIHTGQDTAEGVREIDLTAQGSNFTVKRQIEFNLIKCDTDIFDLDVFPENSEIRRGQDISIDITLFNKSKEQQELSISAESDLPTTLSAANAVLKADEHKKLKLTVRARAEDRSGTHEIIIRAWNGLESETKKIKISVLPTHLIDVRIRNNDYSLRSATSARAQEYEVVVTNKGDYRETLNVEVDNPDESIKTDLSKTRFTLDKGFEEKFTLTVLPTQKTELGRHTVELRITNAQIEEKTDIKFVVEPAGPVQNNQALELVTYPQNVEIVKGGEKEVRLTIKNNLQEEVQNITVLLRSADSAISMQAITIEKLPAGETKSINSKIRVLDLADEGNYNVAFEVRSKDTFGFTKFTVTVLDTNDQKEGEDGFWSGLSGLFTLGSSASTILALLIIAVIILIALSIYNSIYNEEMESKTL